MRKQTYQRLLGEATGPDASGCVGSPRRVIAYGLASVGTIGVVWAAFTHTLTSDREHGSVFVPAFQSAASANDDVGLRGHNHATTSNTSAVAVPTELGLVSAACLKDTGGTCNIRRCHPWRRATCQWSDMSYRCLCPNGCVGSDGGCYKVGQNKLVASGFHLKNAKWPTSYLYVPTNMWAYQLRVGGVGDGDSTFLLYELAGTRNGRKHYMMTSVRHRDYMITMTPSGARAGQLFKMDSTKKGKTFQAIWTVCRPRGHQGPNLKFGVRLHGNIVWSYISQFSRLVFGWDDKIWGPSHLDAEWIPSSPLHVDFDECP